MRETYGDLWELTPEKGVVVVTTNGSVKAGGLAVMGRGCAREAAERYPDLPAQLGERIVFEGNHVHFFPELSLVTFPTKRHWRHGADIGLIALSSHELVYLADSRGWEEIVMPRPGCGYGGLNWEEDVRSVISGLLDDRFLVVTH